MRIILSVAALLLSTNTAFSAPIYVSHSGDDLVGQRLTYGLREAIAKSAQHRIVYAEKDAAFSIFLVTVKNGDDPVTSYSAVLTIPQPSGKGLNYYVTSVAGNCGSSRIPSCADNIMAMFDDDITSIIQAIRQLQN